MSAANPPPNPPPVPPAVPPAVSPAVPPPVPPAVPPAPRAYERKPTGPKRVRDGLKLRTLKQRQPKSALAGAWIDRIARRIDEDELQAGFEYGRAGQLVKFDVIGGAVEATVQGGPGRPYRVAIRLDVLDESHWRGLIERMATEAIHSAKLLSAAVSEELHEAFETVEIELVPDDAQSLRLECSCKRAGPCRHLAATAYLLADRLESDPAQIFTLRGLPFDELLERLRHERQLRTRGVAAAHADPMIPETQKPVLPLEACLDEFWRPGRVLSDLGQAPPVQHVSHALLRRLGPSPLGGKFPMVGLLASIYDTVSQYSAKLRDRAEGIDREDTVEEDDANGDNGGSDDNR